MNNINHKVINFTNNKLINWYKEAKTNHNVIGSATTSIEGDEVKIAYTENGVAKTWSMSFYTEYVIDNGLSFIFDVWAEEAR